MAYKSSCKACGHLHADGVCPASVHKNGSITLRPESNSLWGISGGMVKHWDSQSGSEQLSFKNWDNYRGEYFTYDMDTDCGCRCYIPSDNLEFLEWKYSQNEK